MGGGASQCVCMLKTTSWGNRVVPVALGPAAISQRKSAYQTGEDVSACDVASHAVRPPPGPPSPAPHRSQLYGVGRQPVTVVAPSRSLADLRASRFQNAKTSHFYANMTHIQ